MRHHQISRRTALRIGAAVAALGLSARTATAQSSEDTFTYEVTRSDDEWRARLNATEYKILREGGTEEKKSSPLWNETAEGIYRCRGCDLPAYESIWKVPLDIGFAFFFHALPDSVLTAVDGVESRFGSDGTDLATVSTIETHCRRCGSHHGHILLVEGEVLHCINGTSLIFEPKAA